MFPFNNTHTRMSLAPTTSQPSALIGVFLPLDAEYGRDVLRGIGRFYRSHSNIQVLKFNLTSGYDLDKMRDLRLDGIIAKVAGRREEELFLELNVPTINFSGQYKPSTLPTVTSDDRRIGEMAFRHFAQRGFRHFAYCGSSGHYASLLRLEEFSGRVAERYPGTQLQSLFVPRGDEDAPFPEHVRKELAAWVLALPKPVGVFTFTDRLGLEVDEVCRRTALEVPGKVAILGVGNDLTRIEFAHVPLSSVELPTEAIGYLAAELLEKWRLEGQKPNPYTVLRPQRLITRASTDVLAVPDESVAVALDYIQEHLGNPIRVEAIARSAGVSRRTLEQRFQKNLRQTVYGVVQNLKFEHALEMLGEPGVSIGDIALRIGYPETKAFSRAFHKRFGRSPSAYRADLES